MTLTVEIFRHYLGLITHTFYIFFSVNILEVNQSIHDPNMLSGNPTPGLSSTKGGSDLDLREDVVHITSLVRAYSNMGTVRTWWIFLKPTNMNGWI